MPNIPFLINSISIIIIIMTILTIFISRYADIHPKFGFPLAFRPKFQLNAILRRDTNIPMIRLDVMKMITVMINIVKIM